MSGAITGTTIVAKIALEAYGEQLPVVIKNESPVL